MLQNSPGYWISLRSDELLLNLSNIFRQLLFLLCLAGVRVGGVGRLRRTDD